MKSIITVLAILAALTSVQAAAAYDPALGVFEEPEGVVMKDNGDLVIQYTTRLRKGSPYIGGTIKTLKHRSCGQKALKPTLRAGGTVTKVYSRYYDGEFFPIFSFTVVLADCV